MWVTVIDFMMSWHILTYVDFFPEISRLVGDQIVEINGKRVSAFDEFLERFVAAQVQAQPTQPTKCDKEKYPYISL